MNVIDALHSRFSIRTYKPDPVDRDTLVHLLEAALQAPSWANTQPWEIFVVAGEPLERLRAISIQRTRDNEPGEPDLPAPKEWPPHLLERTRRMSEGRRRQLGDDSDDSVRKQAFLENNRRFFGAPAVVYLCLERSLTPWSVYDIGSLAQSIMLAAQEYGVDSTPAVNLVMFPDAIRSVVGVPDNLLVLMGIALGYRDSDDPRNAYRSERRSLEETVRFAGV